MQTTLAAIGVPERQKPAESDGQSNQEDAQLDAIYHAKNKWNIHHQMMYLLRESHFRPDLK